jgi:outer membrane immunogenic protein
MTRSSWLKSGFVVIFGAASIPALAADVIVMDAPVEPVIQSVGNWSGFYIVGLGGYDWVDGDLEHANTNYFGGPGGTYAQDGNDWVFGAAIGYDHQMANGFVIGAEFALRSGADLDDGGEFAAFNNFTSSRIDVLGTASARLGYAVGDILPFVKAGYAGASVETVQNVPGQRSFSDTEYANGFVLGAGVDVKATDVVTIGFEYNYVDLGTVNFSGPDSAGVPTEIDGDFRSHSLMARVGLRF